MIVHGIITAVVEAVEGSPDLQRRLRALAVLVGIGGTVTTPSDDRQFDTIAQFARRLGVSRRHVAGLRERGMLVTIDSGRALRVDVRASLERLRRDPDRARAVVELDEARRRARQAAVRVTGRK